MQITIAWSGSADVDLALETPDGAHVPPAAGDRPSSAFHRDRECPGEDGCHGQNVENIYFDGESPPRGRYEVRIALSDLHGAEPPVPVRLGARLGTRSVGFSTEVVPGGAPKVFTFEVP